MEPRKPTDEEKELLVQDLLSQKNITEPTEEERQDEIGLIENSAVAVFDHYITDGPGYAGKLMVVVWSGGPEITEVFIWEDNKLKNVKIDL